ncbi:MAG: hypothetical protein CMQ34_14540 [Gammaproteobacteria bacterium]|nr:hypothetical protein [Gammaproteobacteria bacterium]|tara:strand:- start:3193 stop:3540 length:348 start_codon:yes stop_codon:yes gene_type:complete
MFFPALKAVVLIKEASERNVIASMLESTGLTVIVNSGDIACLETHAKLHPDVLIVDDDILDDPTRVLLREPDFYNKLILIRRSSDHTDETLCLTDLVRPVYRSELLRVICGIMNS